MKKIALNIIFILVINFGSLAQVKILPGDKSINKSLLKSSTQIFDYSNIQNGSLTTIGKYKMEIKYNFETLDINTTLSFNNKNKPWKDRYVVDGNSFKPVSIESSRSDRSLLLNFGNDVTGLLEDHNRNKKTVIRENFKDGFFDISIYPYILPALPLSAGFKATLPVFDYEAVDSNQRFSNVIISGVYLDEYRSNFTGTHKVWRVEVFEESTKNTFQYSIDQKTGKFWEIFFRTPDGILIELKNNESDYNPIKSKFDKEETLKLITQGKSIIRGQAFARDNKNGGALQGMAILNVNKKQVAGKGTKIVLTPNTPYFKEWNKINEENYKNILPPLPLPEGADECMKETTIYDEDGHFEFTNLMPGEYLITTSFLYEHDATSTTVVGYNDYYINGTYQGSNTITNSHNFIADVKAKVRKVVKINKDGEMVEIKLKKTL